LVRALAAQAWASNPKVGTMIPCCTINQDACNQPIKERLQPFAIAPTNAGGPQFGAVPHALPGLPADGRYPASVDGRYPSRPMEAKSSSDKDLVAAMLNSILEEHASLRSLVQQQHQALSQKLEGLNVSSPPGQLPPASCVEVITLPIATPSPEDEKSAGNEKAKALTKSELHVASGESSWQRDKTKKQEKKAAVVTEEIPPMSLGEKIISHPVFDVVMGAVILANTCIMFAAIQLKGLHEGWKLGVRDTDPNWAEHEGRFEMMEDVFNCVYLLELLVRIGVYGPRFVQQYSNLMDAFIVTFSCLDGFVLQKLSVRTVNLSVLRLARLTRIFRVAKFLRGAAMFSELRILIATLCVAMRGIIWSVVLLAGIVIAGGIIMAQLAFNFIDNDAIPRERRIWLYEHFGTTFQSIYTMFECTFTGGWRFFSRPLIQEVHYLFAIFWISWIILVNFMTMRVVGALFLKSTLAIANQSDERLAMQAQREKKAIAEKIEVLFKAADESGDGCLGPEEFEAMLEKPEVINDFAEMGLDMDELFALFSVLSSDDGTADYEEFMNGALAMTASSPQLDNMKNSQNQLKLAGDMHLVLDQTVAIRKALGSLGSR